MTFSKLTNTTVALSVWSWTDEEGVRRTRVTVGSQFADLSDEERQELAEYLAQ